LYPPVQQSFRNEIAISFLMILDWWSPVAVACGDDRSMHLPSFAAPRCAPAPRPGMAAIITL